MSPEDKLKELGITLPAPPKPVGSYVPFVRAGNLVFLSGILPLREGRPLRKGRVGEDLTLEEAKEEARVATINAIAILKANLGDLRKIKRCVRLGGYIASAPDFVEQHVIMNEASTFLFEVFGEAGRHVRTAVGVSSLPMNSTIEIEFIFEAEN